MSSMGFSSIEGAEGIHFFLISWAISVPCEFKHVCQFASPLHTYPLSSMNDAPLRLGNSSLSAAMPQSRIAIFTGRSFIYMTSGSSLTWQLSRNLRTGSISENIDLFTLKSRLVLLLCLKYIFVAYPEGVFCVGVGAGLSSCPSRLQSSMPTMLNRRLSSVE